ncbi:hypothetical protein DID88_000696 [Monilinia fructigena]|uniref:Uncharacterized protein n=1 Tax=Monilinia fructigena TaxID=38457 RepID=A0A395IIK3_9HELO|nr:hypothetical protein DID88_000696 [Monilinia fructigena]
MSLTNIPDIGQLTIQYENATSLIETSEESHVERLKELNVKLRTQNRLLRFVIKELQVASTEADNEKETLAAMNVGIFKKIDDQLKVHFTSVQKQNIKVWTSFLDDIAENKKAFDATGEKVDLEKYESAIKLWRRSHIRRDDIDIIICQRVVTERMSNLIDELRAHKAKLESEISRLEAKANEVKYDVVKHEIKPQGQNNIGTGLQQTEKVSEDEMKNEHENENELKERNEIIADLKEKEKASRAEMKSKYEKKLKDKDIIIANLEEKRKSSAVEIKISYEKELKEQSSVIADFEEKERSSTDKIKRTYEEKLKEQNSIVAKLEEEKLTSADEMKGLHRELASHREVSISILSRKREVMKPHESRSDHVIEAGNLSAHGGTCLADAFRIKSNPDVNDSPWFEENYGLDTKTVEMFGESTAFTKFVNMRYDMYNCRGDYRRAVSDFEEGFQVLLTAIREKGPDATIESIDGFLLKNKKAKVVFQKLCSMWDITRESQRKGFQESRDLKKRSIFGGSMRSSVSLMSRETQRTRLDKIEEYGKDMLASAKDAMPWAKK